MWPILKIYIGLVLLTIHVHGNYMDKMSKAIKPVIDGGMYIDGIFGPVSSDIIGIGASAAVFQGVNMVNNCDVAMKFSNDSVKSKREYLMRGYLKAIDDGDKKCDIEKYGISPIYYYNSKSQFESSSITVMPLFECDIYAKKFELHFKFEEIDYLILFRDFVRQTKYMHSCGIRYDDIRPENIMLRKGRSFLIDFNLSSKIDDPFSGFTLLYASRTILRQEVNKIKPGTIKGRPLDDWESFIYTMAYHLDVELTWFDKVKKRRAGNLAITEKEIGNLKKETDITINRIKRDVKFKKLKKIMVEFAKVALKANIRFPDYNHFDDMITTEINDINEENQLEPAVFSWLKDHDRDEAIKDLMKNPPATAKDIEFEKKEFNAEDYVDMNEEIFSERREKMAEMAKNNKELYYLEEKRREFEEQKKRQKKGNGIWTVLRYVEEIIAPLISSKHRGFIKLKPE